MTGIFKKIYAAIRPKLAYVYHNIKYYIKTSKNYKDKGEKYGIVNIDDQLRNDDLSRYFYMLCMYLKNAGFEVVVKTVWKDFSVLKKMPDFKPLILKENYSFVRNTSAQTNTVVLVQPNTPDHIIHLSYGYNTAQLNKYDCIAPYPMYGKQYKFYSDMGKSEAAKRSNRTIKIFFAGDANKNKYNSLKVKRFFDVLSRREVIDFIEANFSNTVVLRKNEDDKLILDQLLNSKEYNNKVIISEVKTKAEDWLKMLSKADFFVCPPGVRMPWSHNSVEAMSMGAIPILEYDNLFYPALENMKNCLSYKNAEELKRAIEKALAMEPLEIENMRTHVLNYYDEHLSVEGITKKIEEFSASPQLELRVGIPFIPTKEEWLTLRVLYQVLRSAESS